MSFFIRKKLPRQVTTSTDPININWLKNDVILNTISFGIGDLITNISYTYTGLVGGMKLK